MAFQSKLGITFLAVGFLLHRTWVKGKPLGAEDKEDKDYHDEF